MNNAEIAGKFLDCSLPDNGKMYLVCGFVVIPFQIPHQRLEIVLILKLAGYVIDHQISDRGK